MKQTPIIAEAEIGKRIKALRTMRRVTLEQLALQTGFTKGYLSKVEKSEKAPPVSTLGNIARALNVTISALLGEDNNQRSSFCFVAKGERPLISRDSTAFGYSFEAVAHKYPNKMMDPFILTLPAKPKKQGVFHHEGEEVLFVLEGKMRFTHGNDVYIVDEGDCIYFDSGIPHFGMSVGPGDVKCFMVIFNSKKEEPAT